MQGSQAPPKERKKDDSIMLWIKHFASPQQTTSYCEKLLPTVPFSFVQQYVQYHTKIPIHKQLFFKVRVFRNTIKNDDTQIFQLN